MTKSKYTAILAMFGKSNKRHLWLNQNDIKCRPARMAKTVDYPPFCRTTFNSSRLIGMQSWLKSKWRKCQKLSPVGAHKSKMVEAGKRKFVGVKEKLRGFNKASSLSKCDENLYGKYRAKWALRATMPKNYPTFCTPCWWRHGLTTWPFCRGCP